MSLIRSLSIFVGGFLSGYRYRIDENAYPFIRDFLHNLDTTILRPDLWGPLWEWITTIIS